MSDAIRVIHGDCWDTLPTLDPSKVWIISDPPYGIGYAHRGGGAKPGGDRWGAGRRHTAPILGDERPFDPSPLVTLFPNVLLWGANHFACRLPATGRWLAWDKLAGMAVEDTFSDVDFAWSSAPGAARIISFAWKGVASIKRGESNGRRWHPAQKPVGVMRWSIEQAKVPPDGIVVDPYAGSGSTGVACARMGLACILIEKDPRYIPIIERRLADAAAPLLERMEAAS